MMRRCESEVEKLVDAAVALYATRMEVMSEEDWRRRSVIRALSAAVEVPYDAGEFEAAKVMALSVIAVLTKGKSDAAADALARVLNAPGQRRDSPPLLRLSSPRLVVIHPN